MKFVTTNKGQQKLCYQGYLFIRQKDLANGAVGWEFEGRRLERCPGRAKTCGDELISQLNEQIQIQHAMMSSRLHHLSNVEQQKHKKQHNKSSVLLYPMCQSLLRLNYHLSDT